MPPNVKIEYEAFWNCPKLDDQTLQQIHKCDINAGRPGYSGISEEQVRIAKLPKEARIAEQEARIAEEEARIAEQEARIAEQARIAEEARIAEQARFEARIEARLAEIRLSENEDEMNSNGWDLFISHSTQDDSHDVYIAVSNYMKAQDLTVFNPTIHLTHYDKINAQAMQDAVTKSKLVIAALSDEFFKSDWCKKEIEAARDNDIKVIPVYSGDDHSNKQIDKWVKKFKNDLSFKCIFKENARDVLNKQNTGSTDKTLKHLATLAKKNRRNL